MNEGRHETYSVSVAHREGQWMRTLTIMGIENRDGGQEAGQGMLAPEAIMWIGI